MGVAEPFANLEVLDLDDLAGFEFFPGLAGRRGENISTQQHDEQGNNPKNNQGQGKSKAAF